MTEEQYSQIGLIAGRGVYPHEFIRAARQAGVKRIVAVAFKGETKRDILTLADEVVWLHVGQLEKMLHVMQANGVKHYVMVGQIAPKNLFHARPDRKMLEVLKQLDALNAHTIFGAVCTLIEEQGISLLPAYRFMESAMPSAGPLTRQGPDAAMMQDVEFGLHVAKTTSSLEIGQTVIVKNGVILAVEAFEGTDRAILRGGRLGGAGAVVIKVAKRGHDMRFDIPVIGMKTMKILKRARIAVLAVEANRTIFLEREKVIQEAEKNGIRVIAVESE